MCLQYYPIEPLITIQIQEGIKNVTEYVPDDYTCDPEILAYHKTKQITTLSQLNKLRALIDLKPLTKDQLNYLGYNLS